MQYQSTSSKDRRSSRRKPLNLAAQLSYAAHSAMQCHIADFCADGVFVRYALSVSESLASQRLAPQDRVKLRFIDDASGRGMVLTVCVARIMDGAFGGYYVDTHSDSIQALLQRYSREHLETADGLSESTGSAQHAKLLQKQLQKTLLDHLEPATDDFFTVLWPELEERTRSAPSDLIRGHFIDAFAVLKPRQASLKASFISHVINGMDQKPASMPQEIGSGDELALVQKDEFEDWLTLKVMVTKVETQYRRALLELKMRLDACSVFSKDRQSVSSGHNPLGPALICFAFHDALETLKLPLVVDRAVLKIFETVLMKRLEPLYDKLNEVLVRQGVLPGLDLKKYLAREDKTHEPEQAAAKAMAAAKADQAETSEAPAVAQSAPARHGSRLVQRQGVTVSAVPTSRGAEPVDKAIVAAAMSRGDESGSTIQMHLQDGQASFSVIQELLGVLNRGKTVRAEEQATQRKRSGEHGLTSAEKAKLDAVAAEKLLPSFRNAELHERLARQQIPPDSQQEVIPALRDRLKADLGDGKPAKKLTSEQDNALDVVDRFFISLLKNNKIEQRAKQQLRSLEVPILKEYMSQPDFFVQKDNAARQVINRIAQLGVKGNRAPPQQISQINDLVVRIQSEHEANRGIFAESLRELDVLLSKQRNLYQRNVERVMAAAEGQEKVTSSKRRVAEEIASRLAGKRVPKAVISLLNDGWRDLLSLVYIRHDEDSVEWKRYLGVIDQLLAFGRHGKTAEFDMNTLVKSIQDGLSTISSQHMPATGVRAELKAFLSGGSVNERFVQVPDAPAQAVDDDEPSTEELRNRGLLRWMQRVQRLRIGDWLRLTREGEQTELVRIAWIGNNSSRFVFVNQMGSKVIDLDPAALAAYLQQGICVIVAETQKPAVNESLENMVKDVYEQLSQVVATDELTGLIQRKEFERQSVSFCQTIDKDSDAGLVLVSVREFYRINEQASFSGGDKALRDIVRICRKLVPEGSLMARYSGDEFMVALKDKARETADTLLTALQSYRLSWKGDMFPLRFLVSCLPLQTGLHDLGDQLRESEDLVRRARAAGGQMPVQLSSRYAGEGRARTGLDGEKIDLSRLKLQLRCQKIIPLHADAQLPGIVEVLINVQTPKGVVIPAAEFVQAAEQSNSIHEVDRWVVGSMLAWMSQNGALIEQMGCILINLSGNSLNDESLLEFIFEQLTAFDCPLEKICFEITEASAISRMSDVADFIAELREYGCRFCLGHFGVGSVAYDALKTLSVDFIKIDGTFVRDLPKDPYDQMMLKSMVDMAHYHGSEVIAPFVEDRQTLDLLREQHIDYAQGFFIERPRALPKSR